MQKNKEIRHSVISTIAISILFIASFMLSGSQFSQQALAIHEGDATTATAQNQTATGGNATATQTPPAAATQEPPAAATQEPPAAATQEPPAAATQEPPAAATQEPPAAATQEPPAAATQEPPAAATQEPPVNQNFVRQGTIASGQDPLPGHEGHELAFVLPPRNDGGVYSGVLTYTASKPVEVVVLHNYDPQNSTAVPEAYGTELTATLPGDGGNVALTLFQPPYEAGINAASVPFTGNALALHTLEDDPFTATYTVNAFATQPESANAPLEFTSAEAEGDEGAAGAEDEEPGAEDEEPGAEDEEPGAEYEEPGAED